MKTVIHTDCVRILLTKDLSDLIKLPMFAPGRSEECNFNLDQRCDDYRLVYVV
jgi:hypothetical protein